jgi:adenylate cyclase
MLALAGLTAGAILLSWFVGQTRFFQTIELKTLDYRFRLLAKQDVASPEIVLAEIDDNSIKHLEPEFGRWPWSRDAHAYFLRFMRNAGARVVAYDILFTENDVLNPEADAFFVEETRLSANVVHAVFLGDQDTRGVTVESDPALLDAYSTPAMGELLDFIQADFPIPDLAAGAAWLGHVANALDSDGPFRHYLLMASHRGRALPSFALAIALAARGERPDVVGLGPRRVEAGDIRAPLNADWRLPIWFNGGPGTYRSYSYSHIVYAQFQIEEGEEPIVDPALFKDKIVMVGLNATGLHDMFTTPFAGTAGEDAVTRSGVGLGKMAGVEVHANVVDNLLNNRYLSDLSPGLNWLIGLSITFMVLVAVFSLRLVPAVAVASVLLAAYLWTAQALFAGMHLRVPVAAALLCWSLALGLGLAYQYWVEGAEKRRVRGIFSRFVSRDVFQQLMDDPEAAKLGGRRMMVTVLFSDLRGFTSLSEKRAPEDIVAQLNEYFSTMVEIVFQFRGTVDKFVGDMIMALFNAPLADPEHADNAVRCAISMQTRIEELNRSWRDRGLPPLACGIGINSGEMIAGNVGAETILSYTVIGDNVNLGARLESLCKEYRSNIIISQYTKELLKGDYEIVELGDVVVKGRSESVKIYQVRA